MDTPPSMFRGKVKWFDARKGFGFIVGPAGEDVFVHYTVIQIDGYRRLYDGEEVDYVLTSGPKGSQAARVVPSLRARFLAERKTETATQLREQRIRPPADSESQPILDEAAET